MLSPSTVELLIRLQKILLTHMAVNIQHSDFYRGSPGDFGGERGQSDGTTWLFQAALHQQVSPQTGRKISKQRKQHRASCRDRNKKGNSSEEDQEIIWPCLTKHNFPPVFVCHIYYHFFHCIQLSSSSVIFPLTSTLSQPSPALQPKRMSFSLYGAPFAQLTLHLDDFAI